MKKTATALMAACLFVACGSSQKQQTGDSTAVNTEKQAGKDASSRVIEGEDFKFDLDKGVLTYKGVNYEFAHVEAGEFTMGAADNIKDAADNEKPAHKVTITQDYYIGKTEVTWALWKAVMGSYPSDVEGQGVEAKGSPHPANWPVDNVSLEQCQAFVSTLGSSFGELCEFRLPTEAEWEFAARGGNKSKHYIYSGSNTLDDVAWYSENTGSGPHKVGTKQPNELGLYDMSGNVAEWCSDMWGKYSSRAQTDPRGPESGSDTYVLRGGNCFMEPANCSVTARFMDSPDNDDNPFYGFRIVFKHYSQDDAEG
jgi:formylglycine-generating enzyme required for sulfatase activity